jgi:actin related protein 2/3 complex subunit 1A/1B
MYVYRWVAKHLKKPLKSTVLSVDWHPDGKPFLFFKMLRALGILLAAGSSDSHARVFSAFIKGLDAKTPSAVWGDSLAFGTVVGDFQAGGWIHSVAFSPAGDNIAFCGHDSILYVANPQGVETVRMIGLPFTSVAYLSGNSIVAAGHDCTPVLFQNNAGWAMIGPIDQARGKESVASGNAAMNKFKQMDSRSEAGTGSALMTVHQNTITCVRVMGGSRFSTSGVDGKLVLWDLMDSGMGNLRL